MLQIRCDKKFFFSIFIADHFKAMKYTKNLFSFTEAHASLQIQN